MPFKGSGDAGLKGCRYLYQSSFWTELSAWERGKSWANNGIVLSWDF